MPSSQPRFDIPALDGAPFDGFVADEAATAALGAALAARLRPGDTVALRGTLGAGKTALCRALIRAACGAATEVPSPTFTLVQTYDAATATLWHFDLYRIGHSDELDELDWDEALNSGIVLVEWPERAGHRLPADCLTVALETVGETVRRVTATGGPVWRERLAGLAEDAFVIRHGWGTARRTRLAGDASTRRYERLTGADGRTALLTRTPDPAIDIDRFAKVAALLRAAGLTVPEILASDSAAGLALQEDLGDASFAQALDNVSDTEQLYELAVDALIALHRHHRGDVTAPPCAELPAFDAARFAEQVELFDSVYLTHALPDGAWMARVGGLRAAWREVLVPACAGTPWSLILRDYHPGNLMRVDRPGVAAAGLIDFQDAGPGPVAYDLMSLLEDARRDVPDDLRARMIARYLAAFPDLDRDAFARSYAVLAAVRHARVLGIFVRLAQVQGRTGYLDHLPRVAALLSRALAHPALRPVADWLAANTPYAIALAKRPSMAIVMAAGFGLRMRPLTLNTPKPLLQVAGRTMLDQALDHLTAAGVPSAVVNAHYLKEQIATHVAGRTAPAVAVSLEDDILETGGGILHALPLLGSRPFFTANADIVWRDGPTGPALLRLADAWDAAAMDALLLLTPCDTAVGYDGPGDFFLATDGRLVRRGDAPAAPYVYAGVQIIRPQAFAGLAPGCFSLNVVWDRLLAEGRLYGRVHDGGWYHVGTPDALTHVDGLLTGAPPL